MKSQVLAAAVLASAALIAGCSTTPDAIEKSSSKADATRTFAENYQEIYRRVSTNAKRCLAGNIGFSLAASSAVDAELYSELGYGEITHSLINVGVRNYYWKARIERAGTGSKLSVSAGNTIANQSMVDRILRWASGNDKC